MRLQLTKRGDYAVRAVLFLAKHRSEEAPIKAQRMADEMKIPLGFLPQVVGDLARAGIVRTYQGKQGGYRLLKDPVEITLLEVIESIEGPTSSDRCVMRNVNCGGENPCAVHDVWSKAQRSLVGVLSQATIAQLAEKDRLFGER